ncbi:hypothetical protein SJ05684_b52540 (plasmid) [Sinorhizobium sojae CCBAU 05684]|uniref:Uncharacterized protein n=1 Tax=Sinorhizobium sojae CCBAU 05684 TaxID=716928 RepID=A0A249PKB3_9HYPH|nr:hypothetical protein SJ05684_b52540 [Sinorhizobium sojae CCBAU 05684]
MISAGAFASADTGRRRQRDRRSQPVPSGGFRGQASREPP